MKAGGNSLNRIEAKNFKFLFIKLNKKLAEPAAATNLC